MLSSASSCYVTMIRQRCCTIKGCTTKFVENLTVPTKRQTSISTSSASKRSYSLRQMQPFISPRHIHRNEHHFHHSSYRYLSTESSSSTTSSSLSSDIHSKLRNMIKPFLLKCHPDVHVATYAKKINLNAIQNLNSYLDTIQCILNGKYKILNDNNNNNTKSNTKSNNNHRIIEIDFMIQVDNGNNNYNKKKKDINNKNNEQSSRRKVELLLPSMELCTNLNHQYYNTTSIVTNQTILHQLQQRVLQHTRQELIKLLRISGLSNETIEETTTPHDIHDLIIDNILGYNNNINQGSSSSNSTERYSSTSTSDQTNTNVFRRAHHIRMTNNSNNPTPSSSRPRTSYEISRDQYTKSIPWDKYHKLYKEAVDEMNADYYTRGLISKNPKRRRAMIAHILSNMRIESQYNKSNTTTTNTDTNNNENVDTLSSSSTSVEPISFMEQLIAFRRLTILFDRNFDKLQMEEFGHMWENCMIVLTGQRLYNTSKSALFKRKNNHNNKTVGADFMVSTGYSFTLHPDLSVTITIPIDFHDDELIDELDRNVWDFYNYIGDGTEDFFHPQQHEQQYIGD